MATNSILFLCPHGGAKSVLAAAYFNRLAGEYGLDYSASAVAADEPYVAVPPPVAALLAEEGFDLDGFTPRRVGPDEMQRATQVVSIGCDLAGSGLAAEEMESWNDVPQASEDLSGSAAAIERHVRTLAERLRGRR